MILEDRDDRHGGGRDEFYVCRSDEESRTLIQQQQAELLHRRGFALLRRLPRPGFRRGIDFYRSRGLLAALTNALQAYHAKFGVFPDLVEPKGYNEKILRFKFFGELKVPEAGDKLATARFIPEAWRDRIRRPTVVWHSHAPALPANDRIAPGVYYLKSNHGSGMFRKIRYPLAEAERAELQALCKGWLMRDYGVHDGEWWYAAFPRRVGLAAKEPIVRSGG